MTNPLAPGSLDGRVALVTGSSRGIGADTARYLAAAGAAVVVNYRSKAPRADKVVAEITEAGGAIAPDAWWIGEVHEQGITLSDDAVDWVEAIANAETPEPPPSP